jgi:hypothetical protein
VIGKYCPRRTFDVVVDRRLSTPEEFVINRPRGIAPFSIEMSHTKDDAIMRLCDYAITRQWIAVLRRLSKLIIIFDNKAEMMNYIGYTAVCALRKTPPTQA